MEHILTRLRADARIWDVLKINVYDRKLQLVYKGQFKKGRELHFQNILKDCSLLFDVQDNRYYLKNR